LGDCLVPKKAPPPAPSDTGRCDQGGGSSASSRRDTSTSKGGAAGGPGSGKSPDEICKWLRSLPESHVPEKAKENICAIVEDGALRGAEFSAYVQQVPPEVCGPKHAIKLKAAWANVLREAAVKEVAMANLANNHKEKATMIVV